MACNTPAGHDYILVTKSLQSLFYSFCIDAVNFSVLSEFTSISALKKVTYLNNYLVQGPVMKVLHLS